MAKPILYLDIVGTLLVEGGASLRLAPYARTFVQEAAKQFELRFLTSLEEHNALAVSKSLEVDIPYVPFRRGLGKATSIDFSREFWWIDDNPTPTDLLRLADERRSDRLMVVDRRSGVTESTLRKLLDALRASGENQNAAQA